MTDATEHARTRVVADTAKVRIKMKSCQIRVRPNSKCLYKRQKRTHREESDMKMKTEIKVMCPQATDCWKLGEKHRIGPFL